MIRDQGYRPDRMKVICCGAEMRNAGDWPSAKVDGLIYTLFDCKQCGAYLKVIKTLCAKVEWAA